MALSPPKGLLAGLDCTSPWLHLLPSIGLQARPLTVSQHKVSTVSGGHQVLHCFFWATACISGQTRTLAQTSMILSTKKNGSGIGSSVLGGVNLSAFASNARCKLRWMSIWGATLSTNCLCCDSVACLYSKERRVVTDGHL